MNHNKNKGIIIIFFLFISNLLLLKLLAENEFSYLDKITNTLLPKSIYIEEKNKDFFEPHKTPIRGFKTIPFDLNNNNKPELFVSNPDNNGAFSYFWRIYKFNGNKYNQIGQMACTSIRISNNTNDNFKDIECYKYINMTEGFINTYKYFATEYYFDKKTKIFAKDFFNNYDD